jgi:hypothetical protein
MVGEGDETEKNIPSTSKGEKVEEYTGTLYPFTVQDILYNSADILRILPLLVLVALIIKRDSGGIQTLVYPYGSSYTH